MWLGKNTQEDFRKLPMNYILIWVVDTNLFIYNCFLILFFSVGIFHNLRKALFERKEIT